MIIGGKNPTTLEHGGAGRPGLSFPNSGFAILKNLVQEPALAFLYEYAMKSAQFGTMRMDDPDVPETPFEPRRSYDGFAFGSTASQD